MFFKKILTAIPSKEYESEEELSKIDFGWNLIKGMKSSLVSLLVISFFVQLLGMTIPIFIQKIVDSTTNTTSGQFNSYKILTVTIIIILSVYLANVLRSLAIGRTQVAFERNLMTLFFSSLLKLPYKFFSNRSSGELIYRMNSNEYIRQILSEKIIAIIIDMLFLILYIIIMFNYSVSLSVLMIVIAILICFVSFMNSRKNRAINEKEISNSTELQALLNDSINNMLTVKATASEDYLYEKWFDRFKKQLVFMKEKNKVNSFLTFIPYTIQLVLPLIILSVGVLLINQNSLTIGELVAFSTLATYFIAPIQSLSTSYDNILLVDLYLDKLFDIIKSKPEETTKNRFDLTNGRIQIQNLYYSFSKFEDYTLNNINLSINSGEKVAIVGKSGSGKSTLLRLLSGITEYESGSINIDGFELKEFEKRYYRQQVGIVVQESQIFKGTIKENILFGREYSSERYSEALAFSGVEEIVSRYYLKDETILSEQGVNISGGERQRIALARAFYAQPKILFLDEPTSSLDNVTERLLMDRLNNYNNTCIIVAHRFYNIESYNKIILMDSGRIEAIGTHKDLIVSNRTYQKLYKQ